MAADGTQERVWPPLHRRGHRVERGDDFSVLDCVMELLADCLKCMNATGRHRTHLSTADMEHLEMAFGSHWVVGYYIDAGWNVEIGICPPCLELIARTEGRAN